MTRADSKLETLLDRANSESLVHPAVYPALFDRATSDLSQSRRRGPHLAEHQGRVSLNQRKRICPLSMMLYELERGEKQNEGKEDRERARREKLG
ncbi:hypothetical protein M405DRAFT_833172 [Rhizopogon salebrosus TDB-379]|nr:hypothetical protein M405DRAFT_833172 [Rhizopogon salebrosus TDB-379]